MARTPAAKVLPPARPPFCLGRTALLERLDRARTGRLLTIVAGAGFGKSTLLATWAEKVPCAYYTLDPSDADLAVLTSGLVDALRLRLPGLPRGLSQVADPLAGPDPARRPEAIAAHLCEALEPEVVEDLVLIVDDVHEIQSQEGSARLLEGLVRGAPRRLHIVMSSRLEPPFKVERLRGQGQATEIEGAALAFSLDEVEELLADLLPEGDRDLAAQLHRVTGGWPAAIRLAAEAVAGAPDPARDAIIGHFPSPGGAVFEYLAAEVFERESAEVRELIRRVAHLERFDAGLCRVLGVPDAERIVADMLRRGLFFEPGSGVDGWHSLSALVRDFVRERWPLSLEEAAATHRAAATYLAGSGLAEEALRAYARVPDPEGTTRVLLDSGDALLSQGRVDGVIRAATSLGEDRSPEVERLLGEALHLKGDWDQALLCYDRAAAGAQVLPAGLARRIGQIHHLRGDLDTALDAYGRGRLEDDPDAETALLLAWLATAHWLRAETDECRRAAEGAFEVATASGNWAALAAAHTALAMLAALEGDRRANDAHYLLALDAAEDAGDVLQLIRIRTNRSSQFIEEGSYSAGLREVDIAIRLAELSGFSAFLGLGFVNRGEAHLRLGLLDEAVRDFEAARAVYQRSRSRMLAYALTGLGDIHRIRGNLAQARMSYEESRELAEAAGDMQSKVPALAGLARAKAAEDPVEAGRLALEAVKCGPGMGYVGALLTAGWVALARGDEAEASDLALEAASAAGRRRDTAGTAESLELAAMATHDPKAATARLEEALAAWEEIGNPLGADLTRVAIARLGVKPERRALGDAAESRLAQRGVRLSASGAAGMSSALAREDLVPVRIRTLGGFAVLRGGETVPAAEWQSKKARDLIKILVSRRGRPVAREALMEMLWPEADPEKLSNRLSVALTTVRSVLDPDKRFEGEHFIPADKQTVALLLDAIPVDVETFLAEAHVGFDLLKQDRAEEAMTVLSAAEASYAGDFLEEDVYEDWAVGLREEARATYVRVARALASSALEAGDVDAAIRYGLRVLERDPYDEEAHLALVTTLAGAGRHGEARRMYRLYEGRMRDLSVEPAPFPQPIPSGQP